MLRTETVTPDTLELLKQLMQDEHLKDFTLVGGTALSLQIGHRISIDLDLFSLGPFDEQALAQYLETNYQLLLDHLQKNTIKGQIKDVKVDLITHAYPYVHEPVLEDGIRLASPGDIAAMKLNAIAGNGTRIKDFIDIASLSAFLSLNQMLEAYSIKYNTRNPFIPLKALSWFQDINFSEPVQLATGKPNWPDVEKRILAMIEDPDKVFTS